VHFEVWVPLRKDLRKPVVMPQGEDGRRRREGFLVNQRGRRISFPCTVDGGVFVVSLLRAGIPISRVFDDGSNGDSDEKALMAKIHPTLPIL
jgi:hypothetical protein